MTLEELESQTLVAPYVDIEVHLKRGAVFLIDESLVLCEVGLAIAHDQRAQVEEWLNERLIVKASPLDLEQWRKQKQFFKILIVQPFVLAQYFSALAPLSN